MGRRKKWKSRRMKEEDSIAGGSNDELKVDVNVIHAGTEDLNLSILTRDQSFYLIRNKQIFSERFQDNIQGNAIHSCP